MELCSGAGGANYWITLPVCEVHFSFAVWILGDCYVPVSWPSVKGECEAMAML